MVSTVKMKSPCPACFANSGHSVVMQENADGTYACPKDMTHKYKKDDDGNMARLK